MAQLQINTQATADQMVEEFVGVGIEYFNASVEGAEVASGIFTMGSSAGLDVEHGIFLSTGDGNQIPGPNTSASTSQSHGLGGNAILTDILGLPTYDAAILEFDFKPMHDNLSFDFMFGSEEYNEYVGAPFNDIYGLFVSGPNPEGGFYDEDNFGVIVDSEITPADTTIFPADTTIFPADTTYIIADTIIYPADTLIMPPDTIIYPADTTIILADTLYLPADTMYFPADTIITLPDTVLTALPVFINNVNNGSALPNQQSSGPCSNCQYYVDNVDGSKNIEFDGITTTINSVVPVQQDVFYHFTIVIADAGDGIFDSGVLLEGESFKSLGPAQFDSFQFLAVNNEDLSDDVTGQIIDNEIYLTVPDGVEVTSLVADFQVGGVYVDVNGIAQISGETPNNFIEPVAYHLEGSNTKDWQVYVETVSGIKQYLFNKVEIWPNPSQGKIRIDQVYGFNVRIVDSLGKLIRNYQSIGDESLLITDLNPGIYFIQLEKAGMREVRKLIVQ